jgi:hypothetical protein
MSAWLCTAGLAGYRNNNLSLQQHYRTVSQQKRVAATSDNNKGDVDWLGLSRKLSESAAAAAAGCYFSGGGEVSRRNAGRDMVRERVGEAGDKQRADCFSEPEGSPFEDDDDEEIEVV